MLLRVEEEDIGDQRVYPALRFVFLAKVVCEDLFSALVLCLRAAKADEA
jgi:hypothetical protein